METNRLPHDTLQQVNRFIGLQSRQTLKKALCNEIDPSRG